MPEPLPTTTQSPAFPALPSHLQKAAAFLPIEELLAEIVERYGGDIAHTRVLGQVTHDFIIGRVKAKTLVTELVRRFGISDEDARIIARELYEAVFEPLGERLKALPPSKPIVLQPLPQQVRPAPPLPPPAPPPPARISRGETWAGKPPAPPSLVPPSRPAPVVPSKPVLRPAPPPLVTEAEADRTLEKILVELPPELRSAVKNIPLRHIIYNLGREHRMTIEEIGRLADAVLQFITGAIPQAGLLGTLVGILKGDHGKAAAVSQELNAKVFGPIREAMKQATESARAGSMKQEARITELEPPKAKALEPLIIYPLPMAPKPTAIRNQESGIRESEPPISKPTDAGTMKQGPPSAPPSTIGGPPPALPIYEEARNKVRKEFEEFRSAQPTPAPQPPPAEPRGPDPYREPAE